MNKNTVRWMACALLAVVVTTLRAAPRDDDFTTLTREVKASTIQTLNKQMKEFYFFPELAAQVEQDLNRRLAAGEYESILVGDEFAKRLTADMRAICKDAHLGVMFTKEVMPDRKNVREPSKAEIEESRKRARQLNGGFEKVERLPGNIGYLEVRGFFPREDFEKPAQAAMKFLGNTDALIIDLRRNGGGDPSSVQYLCSFLFDGRVHLNDISIRGQKTQEYWTVKVPGPTFAGKPVYVLTSKRTGSGAEEFAYNLQALHRGLIVGESTWGGANPGAMVRLNDHFGAFIPNGQAMNPHTKKNWEGTGVIPDIKVPAPEALRTAQLAALKELLEKADSNDDRQRWQRAMDDLAAAP